MKYLLTFIAFLCITPLWADDAILHIKCPEDWKFAINGSSQSLTGSNRQFILDLPKGQSQKLHIFSYTDKSNLVLYSADVIVTGGETTKLDLREEKDKEPIIPEPVKPKEDNKPSFDLFGKSKVISLKKPNFGCIIDKASEKVKSLPKKEEIQSQKIIVSQKQEVQYSSSNNCVTGT